QLHDRAAGRAAADARSRELFDLVGLAQVTNLSRRYPHELSGGQQQRVCIAIALACEPDLVVLDEPTTGLDVTTQQQIVTLLNDLRARLDMSMLYVTHDLGLLAQIADRIGVMYAGHLVETAQSRRLFDEPRHPYTQGLIGSVPRIDEPRGEARRPLRGLLRRRDLPPGCAFAPRCDLATARCREEPQIIEDIGNDHAVACWRWRDTSKQENMPVAPAIRRGAVEGTPVLTLEHLTIAYGVRTGWWGRLFPGQPAAAVLDVDITVGRGETFALVGESGSGKSTVARAVSGLLP